MFTFYIHIHVIGDISDNKMECSLVNNDAGRHASEDSLPMCSGNTVEGSAVQNFGKSKIFSLHFQNNI